MQRMCARSSARQRKADVSKQFFAQWMRAALLFSQHWVCGVLPGKACMFLLSCLLSTLEALGENFFIAELVADLRVAAWGLAA